MNSSTKLLELTFHESNTIALLTFYSLTFTSDLIRETNQILDQLEETKGPMCLITTNAHKKIYSAGFHFNVFKQHSESVHNEIAEGCRMFARFVNLPFPTIAALNGHAIAGGFIFAMSHDVRIMNENIGKLEMSELKLGLPIPSNAIAILQAKLKPQVLREMNLFGCSFTAIEAFHLEIVDKVISSKILLFHAFETAKKLKILAIQREAYQGIKVALYNKAIQNAETARSDVFMQTALKKRNSKKKTSKNPTKI